MDFKTRLQRQYGAIVQDLDVKYIIDELYQKNVMSSSEFNQILNMTNREEQVRYLLDYLIQSGTEAMYESFVDCLAKDYRWLNKTLIEDLEPIMDDSFEDSLSKGDVPRLPDHHARRTVIENKVAEKLRQLKRHEILVLHGMSGSGKTCVAISALRDNPELITNYFNGVVLWLNLANCKTYDDIISPQTNLLRKASSMYNKCNSYMNSSISMSSIGSNGDNPLSALDWTWSGLKDRLKTQFLEQSLKECLLVLDEVNDRKCVQALDIGCKILITTRDKEVVANYRPQIVEIENHLQKEESLQIFASCLDEEVSRLPRQAKTIHELCKGNPFHIALIGAQLADDKEKLKHHRRHWDYYVKRLEKKEFSSLFTRPNENPMKAIEVCINALNDNILQLYKKLAILPDNVKVSTKVITKLWNRDISEVNSIMKQLKAKSLITETYDREQRSYLYEVHDLIMNYLRTCLKRDEKRRIHDEFLTSYNYTSENAPVDILDDGYIAFYVGYHILNTYDPQKQGLFRKLFLNLKFLGNKVRLTGPADVILDLQKYENNIAQDDVDRSLIANIKSYLSTHGTDLYRYQCTDIIQSILQHESQGILFARASEVAQVNSDKNELYFNLLHEQDSDGIKHSTIDVDEQITCISFLGNDLLVGTSDGVVKFFDIPTNKFKKQLFDSERCGGEPVEWIGVAYTKSPPIVAVLFASGVIKLWFIDDLEQDVDEDTIEEEPEETYNNNVPGTVTIKSTMLPIVKCHWTNKEDLLVAQTTNMVILYLPTGEVVTVFDKFERNVRLLCSVPCSNDDGYVAVATAGSRKGIEILDMKANERKIIIEDPSPDSEPVLDILSVFGSNKIITLKSREVTQYEYKIRPNTAFKSNKFTTSTIIKSYDIKNNLTFLSMAVNKSGTLLFISTDDSRVISVDLKTKTYLFDLDNRRGNVVTMAVSEIVMWDEFVPNSDVLLTGTETIEKSAKVWYLDAPYISQAAHKNGKVRLTTNFDVSFRQSAASPSQSSTDSNDMCIESTNQTPKRHQSFNHNEVKKVLKSTRSLDIRALKRLNLKGICNISEESEYCRPLLAVIDDNNNIQVMCGRKLITEIVEKSDDLITTVKISPFNQYIIYGLESGNVKKYTLQTKEVATIMDMYSPVQYMEFVGNLLLVAGENRCIMAYRFNTDDSWMMQRGNTHLGSQEILNDIQGFKKRSSQADLMSHSSSDLSLESKDRQFPNEAQTKELYSRKGGGLVDCFAVDNDLITIENNGTVKLWVDLKLSCILHARQVNVRCAAFESNVLVICDGRNMVFQTYQLKMGTDAELTELNLIQEKQIDSEITSCDLTADGNILALGLSSGDILLWNVRAQRQISILRHHKSKVRSCSFSEVPSELYRSLGQFGTQADDEPPLVLVTMAAEIVWWDVSYVMRMRAGSRSDRPNLNAMTPLASPHSEVAADGSNANGGGQRKFVFLENRIKLGWKDTWNSKTYKQGSKRKEILACIKLTGMYAKRLCHDKKFTCFVTVDNPGHIHIMNVIRKQCT